LYFSSIITSIDFATSPPHTLDQQTCVASLFAQAETKTVRKLLESELEERVTNASRTEET